MSTATVTTRDRVRAVHEARLRIAARQPFEFRHALEFVAGFPATRGEQVVADGALVKAWRLYGHTVATRIGAGPGGLVVDVASPDPVDAVLREAVTDRLSFFLSLDDDLSPLLAGAGQDPAFAAVEAELRGYHQVKFPTPVEHVVWAILAQRTPMAVARDAKARLMAALNPPVQAFGYELQPFPSLNELNRLSEEQLAEHVRNTRKASYLHRTLQQLAEVDESFLRHAPYEEVEQFLLSLPGIGPWSATFVLIRGLGRMERGSDDAEMLRAASRVYGHAVDAAELARLAEPYGDARGYWAHYLRVGG
ncbi:DNA-3-methyladenine glycosylase family protein [Spongisporangium articulatum]|uniref:DNA-3-methyladenine glycosylase II n=1 Tax=Spongisporangium articulatum TaxID=3362603 RepID=A0ABW8ALJ5_9ACTN